MWCFWINARVCLPVLHQQVDTTMFSFVLSAAALVGTRWRTCSPLVAVPVEVAGLITARHRGWTVSWCTVDCTANYTSSACQHSLSSIIFLVLRIVISQACSELGPAEIRELNCTRRAQWPDIGKSGRCGTHFIFLTIRPCCLIWDEKVCVQMKASDTGCKDHM